MLLAGNEILRGMQREIGIRLPGGIEGKMKKNKRKTVRTAPKNKKRTQRRGEVRRGIVRKPTFQIGLQKKRSGVFSSV